MTWSKSLATYPAPLAELWYRVMETGADSVHKFPSTTEARRFQKTILGIRYAHMNTKDGPNREKAAMFTAEILEDGLTVRLCAVDDTERAKVSARVLKERREQDAARGIDFMETAGPLEQYLKEPKAS